MNLEGSFVQCERRIGEIIIFFHNPSVRDFLEKCLAENTEMLQILFSSIIFYGQFLTLYNKRPRENEHANISNILSENCSLVSDAIIRTVCRTARKKGMIRTSDGNFLFTSRVPTTVEKNIAHALEIVKTFPESHNKVATQLLEIEESRINNAEGSIGELIEVLRIASDIDQASSYCSKLIEKVARQFESLDEYAELEKIIDLQNFMELAPDKVSEELIEKVKKKIEVDAESIYESEISQAKDDQDIDNIREIATEMKKSFGVSLEEIFDLLDYREEELQAGYDEFLSDDMYGEPSEDTSEADDEEIISIFESFKE